MWGDLASIFTALASQDAFMVRTALRTDAAWVFGTLVALLGGLGVMYVYRRVPFVERHLERTIMVYSYLAIALIIFWGVVDRFIFSQQVPWSTTVPPFLFMMMAWFGAAYNVRLRTHLSFSEFRTRMPRAGQMACLVLDAVLWFGLAVIVLTTTLRLTANSAANFQIVLGTDNMMQWWFIATIPAAFVLLAGRIFQNLAEDIANWRSGKELIKPAVIGGDE